MIVLLNGSFAVGKTTTARILRRSIPGSRIYDPEWAGLVLMRLPRWIRLQGRGTDDFQDIALWRASVSAGIRLLRLFSAAPVIVPMTFSRRAYLEEVLTGMGALDTDVRVFCLKASLGTIRRRLAGRGDRALSRGSEWIARRIEECVEAHRQPHFGEAIETEERPASAVAADVLRRLH